MVIDSFKVDTHAQRTYTKVQATQTTITAGTGGANGNSVQLSELNAAVVFDFSESASSARGVQGRDGDGYSLGGVWRAPRAETGHVPGSLQELKLEALRQVLSVMTGRDIELSPAEHSGNARQPESSPPRPSRGPGQLSLAGRVIDPELRARLPRRALSIIERYAAAARARLIQLNPTPVRRSAATQVQTQSYTYEREAVSYNAKAIINTKDGRSIDVDLHMSMSREFMQYASTTVSLNPPVDPLVINYGGTAASLTERKFDFDLDADGKTDKISFAGPGSGFLALDKNGDGIINDGSELFGPGTGSGFDELRAYDKDGNGWIDEADTIFDKLLVWTKDENGNDKMYKLKDLGIGAVYLGAVDTKFSMQSASGAAQGAMQATSFFLREDGSAGYVHHIDLYA